MSIYELGLFINLVIVVGLILDIFSCENVIVYNGVKYPVKFDYINNRVECRLFGGVKRYIKHNNQYNIFGVICSVI